MIPKIDRGDGQLKMDGLLKLMKAEAGSVSLITHLPLMFAYWLSTTRMQW